MIPFTIHEFKLFAPATINGQIAYAYLDTGARRTSITPTAAVDMDTLGKTTIRGALGQQELETVCIPSIEFLGEQSHKIEAAVESAIERYVSVPFLVSLTLGVPELLAKPLVLDFKRLSIGFANKPLQPDSLIHLRARFIKGIPMLDFHFGSQRVHAIFDTGAGLSVLNSARREELELEAELAYSTGVNDPTGAYAEINVFRHTHLKVNDLPIGECEFLEIDLRNIEKALDTRIDFVFGVNTMLRSGQVWIIDSSEGCIWLATAASGFFGEG